MDFAVRLCRQPRQDIFEVSEGIVAIELGGLDQAHDGGGTFSGAQAAGKEPVLAAERDGPDTILDPVVIDGHLPVVQVMDKRRPPLEAIVDRFCGGRTIGHLPSSRAQPGLEFIDNGFGVALP